MGHDAGNARAGREPDAIQRQDGETRREGRNRGRPAEVQVKPAQRMCPGSPLVDVTHDQSGLRVLAYRQPAEQSSCLASTFSSTQAQVNDDDAHNGHPHVQVHLQGTTRLAPGYAQIHALHREHRMMSSAVPTPMRYLGRSHGSSGRV